jgi:hypothetical protein
MRREALSAICKNCLNLPAQTADFDCAATPIPLSAKGKSDAGKTCSRDRHAECDGRRLLLLRATVLRSLSVLPVPRVLRATLSLLPHAARMLRMRPVLRIPVQSAMPPIPTVQPTTRHFTVSLRTPRFAAGSLQRPLDQIRSLSSTHDASRPGPRPTNAQYGVFPAAALSWWPDGRTSTRSADRQSLLRANQQSRLRPRLRRSAVPAKSTAITGEFS